MLWVSFLLFFLCVLTGFGIVRYDRDASRYHKGVYGRKRRDLVAALDATLSPLFLGQLKNLHKSCLVAFKQELLEGLRGDDYSFADVVAKARETCEEVFTTGAKEALVEGTDWTWEEELELLKEEAKIVSDQCRKDETKKMLNQIEVCSVYACNLPSLIVSQRNVKKSLSEPVELRLNKASKTMWDQILRIFRDILDKAETSYLSKAKSMHTTFVVMIIEI
jgi:protein SEY1